MDFFAGLFGSARSRRAYAKRTAELQDLLGLRNDIVVARVYLKELNDEMGPEADRILEFIRGWHAREAEGVDKAIGKSWKKFQREDIFWT